MTHYLIRYESGPGRPMYTALCGCTSESGKEFTKETNPSKAKVTCPACMAMLAPIIQDEDQKQTRELHGL